MEMLLTKGEIAANELIHCGRRTMPLPWVSGSGERFLGYTSHLCERTWLMSGIKTHVSADLWVFQVLIRKILGILKADVPFI